MRDWLGPGETSSWLRLIWMRSSLHRERDQGRETSRLRPNKWLSAGLETTTARQQLITTSEQALVELSGLGFEPSGRPALNAQIAEIKRELANLDQSTLNRARTMMSNSEHATTSVEISEAESNLEQTESAEKGIEEELEER